MVLHTGFELQIAPVVVLRDAGVADLATHIIKAWDVIALGTAHIEVDVRGCLIVEPDVPRHGVARDVEAADGRAVVHRELDRFNFIADRRVKTQLFGDVVRIGQIESVLVRRAEFADVEAAGASTRIVQIDDITRTANLHPQAGGGNAPSVVRGEVVEVIASRQLVAGSLQGHLRFVGDGAQVLLHIPSRELLHVIGRGQRRPGVNARNNGLTRRAIASGKRGCNRDRASTRGHETHGLQRTFREAELVIEINARAQIQAEVTATDNTLPATAAAQIDLLHRAIGASAGGDDRGNAVVAVQLVVGASVNAGNVGGKGQEPFAVIIGVAGEDVQLADVELAGDVRGELAALFGIKPGLAHRIARSIIATDHVVGVFSQLAADEAVNPTCAIVGRRDLDGTRALVMAFAQQDVGGQARLAIGEDGGGAAVDSFNALHRLIDTHQSGLIHERGAVGAEHRNAIELHRQERRIARGRDTAHHDVGRAHAARAFDPNARNRLQQIAGALGVLHRDVGRRHGGDRVASFELADTSASVASDDDFGGSGRVSGAGGWGCLGQRGIGRCCNRDG